MRLGLRGWWGGGLLGGAEGGGELAQLGPGSVAGDDEGEPAGLVRYIERWPRAGVVLRFQACPFTEDGGSAVPLLVIRRTNAAGSALVSSSEASSPSGVM